MNKSGNPGFFVSGLQTHLFREPLTAKNWLIIGLAAGILFLLSNAGDSNLDTTTTQERAGIANEAPLGQSLIPIEKSIREQVNIYFNDTPIMSKVAWCESRFRHTDKEGNVFRGNVNNRDVGVMQINEDYHLDISKKLGFDIYTLRGNMAYARYLYKEQGTKPWVSSSKCWNTKSSHSQELAVAGSIKK